MTNQTDVKVKWVEGDMLAGTTDGIAAVQTITLADPVLDLNRTSFTGGVARRVSITTTARGRPLASIFIVGTGADDQPLTASITASQVVGGGTVASSVYFKTITSATASEQWIFSDAVSVGMLDVAREIAIPGHPLRLKGYSTAAPLRNTNNFLEFHDGDFSPESLIFEMYISPLNINYPVPDEGVQIKNGLYLQYTVGSLLMANVFYT